METLTAPETMRRRAEAARREGLTIGFVPTMGFLHEGHLSLVRQARAACDLVVVSVFVNPAQFSPGEDLERYPRDLVRDSRMLAEAGADVLFAPESGAIYRPGHDTWVDVPGLAAGLCGPFRPGHFRGVATVVTKLFNIVRPDIAWFGQKDAQQAALLVRMAEDLDFGVRIVVAPTVREPDGLAMSSRNAYLTPAEREAAPALYAALREAERAVRDGFRALKAAPFDGFPPPGSAPGGAARCTWARARRPWTRNSHRWRTMAG